MSQALLQPVLFGGLFMGVLSALPIISVGNCCCLWVTGGGVVTAYLIQHGRPDPIRLGEGAFGGFLSGIVGAVVYAVVSVPVQLVTGGMMDGLLESAADVPPEMREMIESLASGGGVVAVLVGFVLMLAGGMVFSPLGGLLGALIFRSTPPAESTVPPPPPELPA